MKLLCIAVLLLLVAAPRLAAQGNVASCSYDLCALRIKAATFTQPQALVRGQSDSVLVSLGLFKPAVTSFMLRSDSAVVQSRIYDRLYDTAGVITIVGTVISIAAPIIFEGTLRKIGWTAAGIGVTIYGGVLTNQANEALSRAIWWHNRELIR
jgi:hypothetical protein